LVSSGSSQDQQPQQQEIETAQRYAKLSRAMLELPGLNKDRARVFINNVLVSHWRVSLSMLTDTLLLAYMYGLKTGDVVSGFRVRIMNKTADSNETRFLNLLVPHHRQCIITPRVTFFPVSL
jgi:hypothetical protein